MERLAREKITQQQKLVSLKKELAATWDHIDFNALIPEPAATVEPSVPKNGKCPAIGFYFYYFFLFNKPLQLYFCNYFEWLFLLVPKELED